MAEREKSQEQHVEGLLTQRDVAESETQEAEGLIEVYACVGRSACRP